MENGLTEEKIQNLDAQTDDFSPREALALEFAEKMAIDHHNIDDRLFEQLRTEFSDPEVLELGMMIGQYIGYGRLLKVLDLEDKYCTVDD